MLLAVLLRCKVQRLLHSEPSLFRGQRCINVSVPESSRMKILRRFATLSEHFETALIILMFRLHRDVENFALVAVGAGSYNYWLGMRVHRKSYRTLIWN